jgi:phage baseplate assembly protein W
MSQIPQFAFPYGFDPGGRTAGRDEDAHVRDMIEQLLLTRPGERVNRPDFGAGLMHAVFGAAGPEAATALELASRAALHRYLGDLIEIQSLTGRADDAALVIDVHYVIRRTGDRRVASVALGEPT